MIPKIELWSEDDLAFLMAGMNGFLEDDVQREFMEQNPGLVKLMLFIREGVERMEESTPGLIAGAAMLNLIGMIMIYEDLVAKRLLEE